MAMKNKNTLLRQAGFGLAEIMIAVAIGLISSLVIMQVVTTFEGQKRTTSGNADAQTNGTIALYTIQRQLQMAGFGLPVFSHQNQPLNCNPSPTFDHDGNPATSAMGIFPADIADGGAGPGASDSIVIRSSSAAASMGGAPIAVSNVDLATNVVTVANNMACQVNDIVVVSNGANCVMGRVSAIVGTTGITLQSAAGVVNGATLGCMTGWRETQYSISSNNLVENNVPSVSGIVNIQAQYGISNAAANNQVTAWVDASGPTWAAPTVANRNRIKAIRIAVVARNGLLEAQNVSSACSSLTDAEPTGVCAWAGSAANPAPAIDLSKNTDGTDNPNWRRYRYRVFETIIPLRNMIWSNDTL